MRETTWWSIYSILFLFSISGLILLYNEKYVVGILFFLVATWLSGFITGRKIEFGGGE